jgi:hypothetical protein
MARTDVYLKVELDLPDSERTQSGHSKDRPERLASEICRMIRKLYGVRNAEVSSIIEKET